MPRRMLGLRRWGGLVSVALVAGACGSGTVTPGGGGGGSNGALTPKAAVENAIETTRFASSFTMTGSVTLKGVGSSSGPAGTALSKAMNVSISGAVSRSQKAYEIQISLPKLGGESVAYDGASQIVFLKLPPLLISVLRLATKGPGVPASARAVLTQIVNNPTSWLEVKLTQLPKSGQLPLATISPFNALLTPTPAITQAVDAALTSVSSLGQTTVDGATTTEYAVTLDLARLLNPIMQAIAKSLPKSAGAGSAAVSSMIKAILKSLGNLKYNLFVDAAGFIRRVTATFSLAQLFKSAQSHAPSGSTGSAPASLAPILRSMSNATISVVLDESGFNSTSVQLPTSNVIDITPLAAASPKSVAGF